MKTMLRLISVFVLLLFSCSSLETHDKDAGKSNSLDSSKNNLSRATNENSIADTIKKFVVDGYPLADEMFGRDINNNAREIKSGEILSLDHVWFSNEILNQTLVFELATDNFRMVTFHFANNNIPKELIRTMELITNDREPASDRQKERFFNGFLRKSKIIPEKHFTTDKGFKLGDKKQKALAAYGKPDKIIESDNWEIYEWDFVGDALYDGRMDLKGKRIAENSYGHQTTMFFKNNRLLGIIFHNDIP